jgi:hypothetical protein
MSSGSAIGAFLSASRLVSRALGKEHRALKRGTQSTCRKPRSANASQSSAPDLRDAGLRHLCGLIIRADNKGNEQRCTSQDSR